MTRRENSQHSRKRGISHPKYMRKKKKRKERKYTNWQYNQVVDYFTIIMFGMANVRCALFRVPFLQFSPTKQQLLALWLDLALHISYPGLD
jgi:hypothetical protein